MRMVDAEVESGLIFARMTVEQSNVDILKKKQITDFKNFAAKASHWQRKHTHHYLVILVLRNNPGERYFLVPIDE
jgi:hypothetical protein